MCIRQWFTMFELLSGQKWPDGEDATWDGDACGHDTLSLMLKTAKLKKIVVHKRYDAAMQNDQ